jgi:hypothetical protein
MKEITINIGIDFGTSYSKVCYQDSVTNKKNYVEFDTGTSKPKYKHSILYYDYHKEILYYARPNNNNSIEVIRYFKYSIIDRSLRQQTSINFKSDYDVLCCIFFIACLIKKAKEYIKKRMAKQSEFKYHWAITMGVPVDNYSNEYRKLYDKILQIAINLSDNIDNYSIQSKYLDECYQKHCNIEIPEYVESPNNTLSELYAECISFLDDPNVPEGLYAIIDIGGATVDMAVIYKKLDNNRNEFGIVSKSIQPLGIEIVIKKIALEDKYISDVRKLLHCNDFNPEKSNYKLKEEKLLSKQMKETFAKLAIEAKEKNDIIDIREILKSQKGVIKVIICGGGVDYKWYKSCISSTQEQIRHTLDDTGYKIKFESVDTLKRSYKVEDHRLIIANSLARPIGSIPLLEGFPWHFQKRNGATKTVDTFEKYYDMIQTQNETYSDK